MPSSRRGDRRDGDRGRSVSSRRGERSGARRGRSVSSRRGRESESRSKREGGRPSGRDEDETGRHDRVQKKSNTPIIIGGVVGALVVIVIIAIAASGGRKKRRRRRTKVPASQTRVVASRRNWHHQGMLDGADWKRRSSMRGTFDPKEVDRIADMKTSDYYNKGLRNNREGQKRYIAGFRKGVFGQ